MYKEKIRAYLDAHREEMIEDIKALVRIDSARTEAKEGMPFGEGPAAALAEGCRILEKHGFAPVNYDNYAIDARYNNKELQLDVLAHLDVVPAGEGWTVTEPFEPVVIDGKIYGRGTCDDKGPAMAAVYALLAIRDLGIELKKDVRLILGADEECGSSDIDYYFKKNSHAPMAISPDAEFPLIFIEKGSLHTSFEATLTPSEALPKVVSVKSGLKVNVVPAKAEAVVKGMSVEKLVPYCQKLEKELGVTVELTAGSPETESSLAGAEKRGLVSVLVKGTSAHAASPMDGNNALTALLQLIASLPLAESSSFEMLRKVSRLFPHGDYHGAGLGVNHEDEISGKLTLTLDIFNMDETKLGGLFDCRACISANDENTRQVVYRRFEEAGFTHDNRPMGKPHYVPKESELVRTLLESNTKITGRVEEPLAIGGGTYVHGIENGVACGCGDLNVDTHMHGPDEFVIVEQLLMSAEIFADAFMKLCGVEE